MKINKKIFFLIFILIVGCTDFLQIDPQGDLTQASFPASSSDALQATNAVYAAVRDWYYNSGGYPILDIMSDDAYKGSNSNDQLATVGAYDNFTFNTTGDGLVSGLQLATVIKESGKTLSELAAMMTELPQVLVNAMVPNDKNDIHETDSEIVEEIKKIEVRLNGCGRVLVRPSGTEPLVRVMLEGKIQSELNEMAHSLANLIELKANI